jgi:hypothetical protein
MVRFRAWLTSVICVLSLALAGLTVAVPDWIEEIFEASPDAGSGGAEAGLALVFLAVAIGSGVAAVLDWRRVLRARP